MAVSRSASTPSNAPCRGSARRTRSHPHVVELEVVAVEHVGLDPALALAVERRVGADADRGRVALAGVEAPQPAGVHAVGGCGGQRRGRARSPSGSPARGHAGRRAPPPRGRRTGGRAPRPRRRRRRRPGRCGRTSTTRPAGRRRAGCPRPRSRARSPSSRRVATSPAARCRSGSWPRPRRPRRAGASTSTRSANSCGVHDGDVAVERQRQHVVDAGRRASSRPGVSMSVSVVGACSGRSTAIGCGSKVTATTRSPSRVGDGARPRDDVLVAEVHAVEVADDDRRAAEVGRDVVEGPPDLHGGRTLAEPEAQTKTATGRGARLAAAARRARGTRRRVRTPRSGRLGERQVEPAADAHVGGLRPRRGRAPGSAARAASAIGHHRERRRRARRGCGPRRGRTGPTAVRRSAVRWPPTPSAAPRSRAIART